jgi:hypothetical protein
VSGAGCYSIAPCGTCDGCRAIAAMPPWTPERATGRDWRTMTRDMFDSSASTVQTALLPTPDPAGTGDLLAELSE